MAQKVDEVPSSRNGRPRPIGNVKEFEQHRSRNSCQLVAVGGRHPTAASLTPTTFNRVPENFDVSQNSLNPQPDFNRRDPADAGGVTSDQRQGGRSAEPLWDRRNVTGDHGLGVNDRPVEPLWDRINVLGDHRLGVNDQPVESLVDLGLETSQQRTSRPPRTERSGGTGAISRNSGEAVNLPPPTRQGFNSHLSRTPSATATNQVEMMRTTPLSNMRRREIGGEEIPSQWDKGKMKSTLECPKFKCKNFRRNPPINIKTSIWRFKEIRSYIRIEFYYSSGGMQYLFACRK